LFSFVEVPRTKGGKEEGKIVAVVTESGRRRALKIGEKTGNTFRCVKGIPGTGKLGLRKKKKKKGGRGVIPQSAETLRTKTVMNKVYCRNRQGTALGKKKKMLFTVNVGTGEDRLKKKKLEWRGTTPIKTSNFNSVMLTQDV